MKIVVVRFLRWCLVRLGYNPVIVPEGYGDAHFNGRVYREGRRGFLPIGELPPNGACFREYVTDSGEAVAVYRFKVTPEHAEEMRSTAEIQRVRRESRRKPKVTA